MSVNKNPHITVYIPSHNYGRYLIKAIDSVLHQIYEDWELIIINDASSDDTAQVMQLYENHPKITLLHTDGIGLPAVCNLALKHAKGDYVIRLDGDDVFDENILLVLATHLDKNPNIALVFPDFFLVDDFGQIYAHDYRHRMYDANHVMHMPPNGACTLIRKNILEEVGGYREDLGSQDGFDIWSKISKNYKAHNINLPLFYYRRHGNNLTTNKSRILVARRQIKLDAVKEKLENHRPVTAIIPCRRQYDFMKDLWQSEVGGISLLKRGIQICLNSSLIDRVVVTCDNPMAKEVVNEFDDPRLDFFLRDEKSTILSSSIVPTLEKITQKFDPKNHGISVLRFIQTPFVTTGTLEEAITTLVMNQVDSTCSIEPLNTTIYRRTAHGLEALNQNTHFISDMDAIYRDAQTFTASLNHNFSRGSLTGSSIGYFEVTRQESFFINSPQDLEVANILAKGEG